MSMRSQTIAIAVLLVAVGIIFLLVGNAGVSTGVFLPEPTLTPIPPTATPLPDPAADHWSESAPGQVAYTADAERSAQIAYQTMPLDTFIEQRQLEAPAEDVLLHQWQLATEFLHSEATEGWPPGINAGEDWQATLDILAEYAGLANPGAPSDYWDGSFAPEFEPEMGGEVPATEAAE